jgi:transposase
MTDDTIGSESSATTILALDLGKFKSVGCVYEPESGTHRFETIATSPSAVHDLLIEIAPARLVIEACSIAGWVADLARTLGIYLQVANVTTEAWKWQRVKRKTDRDDALKLAKLSIMNQLPTVHIPEPAVRQHRGLIKYRHTLIDRRTGIKNTIRSLLDSQGLSWPARSRGWTIAAIRELFALSRPLAECDALNLWRGELHLELRLLEQVSVLIAEADRKLNALVAKDARVMKLKTIPGVGDRLAELVVSTIDDVHRFKNGRQVGAYAGLAPKQYQSGTMNRHGRITAAARACSAGCWCRWRGACSVAPAAAKPSSSSCAMAAELAASRRWWRWRERY